MECILTIAIIYAFYYLFFREEKYDLLKLKNALKDTSLEELKFVNELISKEIKSRSKNI